MRTNYLLEACVENYQEALLAQKRGAHQIELCSRLDLDGMTPNTSEIAMCIGRLSIPVKVMIRPRAGSFVTKSGDIDMMTIEIQTMRQIGVRHIVLGLTTPDLRIDINALKMLFKESRDMNITIHKAIDTCTDILKETERLLTIDNVRSILTSGGKTTASDGAAVIKEMIAVTKGKIQIIPAGKITDQNITELHEFLQAPIYHGRKIVGALDTSSEII